LEESNYSYVQKWLHIRRNWKEVPNILQIKNKFDYITYFNYFLSFFIILHKMNFGMCKKNE
jgi:hypothetical protein